MPGGVPVFFIALTHQHAMMIADDYKLFGFGLNNGKVLGVGDSVVRYTPTPVLDNNVVFAARPFAHVAITPYVAIACATDGAVFTWGSGSTAARGTADVGDYPQVVSFGSTATFVAAGGSSASDSRTLIVTFDGKVFTMGDNNNGMFVFEFILTKNRSIVHRRPCCKVITNSY
jgi:alpha-tubulin suppressor-like RCC1 family protein